MTLAQPRVNPSRPAGTLDSTSWASRMARDARRIGQVLPPFY
jgi:hypothetical protein